LDLKPGGRGLKNRIKEIQTALKGRNIKVSAICAGFDGFILSTDPAIRRQCRDTMEEIIAAAGELGSTGVIIVPLSIIKFRRCLTRKKRETFYANSSTKWAILPATWDDCYF
jgi:sugar phosphate isomerase/epimerase